MKPSEAFIIGFLSQCALEGLQPKEIEDRIEKTANALWPFIRDIGSKIFGKTSDAGEWLLGKLGWGAIFGPWVAGLPIGMVIGSLLSDEDQIEDFRVHEEAEEYRRSIDQLVRASKHLH